MRKLLSLAAVLGLSAVATAQSPLSTIFASNNGGSVGGAVYFDINVTLATGITITGIDVNTATVGAGTLDVYTIAGGRTGMMSNQAAWTGPSSLGSPVTLNGTNVPSPCTLNTPIQLAAGNWGIALVAGGFGHSYTNGNGTNQTYSTLEATLNAGNADNAPWGGGAFTPRVANVNIHYSSVPGGTVFATKTNYGTGCTSGTDTSFYENFATGTMDLGGVNMSLLHTGQGFLALGGLANYVAPSASAQVLALTDDSETSVTLSAPLRVGSTGSTTTLTVCSNGFVSTGTGNGTSFSPASATMLNNPRTGWYCWHDFNPAAAGSGSVKFEEIGGIAYVTFDGVYDFGGTTAANANTFQMQFELATGTVHMCFGTMSNLGNGYLVGFSEGGASADPGSMDISVALPGSFNAATFAVVPLAFSASARPITNTSISLDTTNIPSGSPFGAVIIGLNQLPSPFDLTVIGMPGCFQYTDQLFNSLYFPSGNSASVNFNVPNLVNLNIHLQSFDYAPAAGRTPLGAIGSNAVHLTIGDW